MGKAWSSAGMSFEDVLRVLREVEETYAIKARISVVPRPRVGYRQGCIVLVTAYDGNGKKIHGVAAPQALWPTTGHKSIHGLQVYLLHQLVEAIEAHEVERLAQGVPEEEGRLTLLEEYIAASYRS